RLLHEELVTTGPGRRQEDPVRLVREAFLRPEDPYQPVHPVVVRLHVVIADRPVVPQAVEALVPEVPGPEAQRDPAPVVRAPADHAGTPPVEPRPRRLRVRLPSMFHPPMQASNSPNGRSRLDAPRRSVPYGQASIAESLVLSQATPASSTM